MDYIFLMIQLDLHCQTGGGGGFCLHLHRLTTFYLEPLTTGPARPQVYLDEKIYSWQGRHAIGFASKDKNKMDIVNLPF